MRAEEISEVLRTAAKLDVASMDIIDQMEFYLAANQYAERLKPLIVKYADKLPEETTFLFKM